MEPGNDRRRQSKERKRHRLHDLQGERRGSRSLRTREHVCRADVRWRWFVGVNETGEVDLLVAVARFKRP